MAKAKSEWLTLLHCSFQDQENLYLVILRGTREIGFLCLTNLRCFKRLWNFILAVIYFLC